MDSFISTPTERHATITTREEAIEKGLTRYFTGKPCKHGHIAERNTVSKNCMECGRLKSRVQYRKDPAAENARRKAQRQAKPEHYKTYSRTYGAKWKRENPDKVNENNRRWREKNPEKALEMRLRWEQKHAERMQNDPEYFAACKAREKAKNEEQKRKRDLKRAGEVRPDNCTVCGKGGVEICWDHCHQSGKFRGWLCHPCNWILGFAEDSPELLRKLAEYLEKT